MSFANGSMTYSLYRLEPELGLDFPTEALEALEQNRFVPFEEVDVGESALGWVSPRNFLHLEMLHEEIFPAPEYLLVSLRVDRRRAPARMLKAMLPDAEREYLEQVGKDRLSRDDRQFVRDQVRRQLIRQQFPSTQVWDVLWHLSSGRLYFGATTPAACDLFAEYFRRTFDRRPQLMFPEQRAAGLDLDSARRWALEKLTPEAFGGGHGG